MTRAPRSGDLILGTVVAFDPEVGLGTVAAADGSRHDFHCTAIADGSRTIDPEGAVAYSVGPAGPGRWEAVVVLPLTD